MINNFMIFGITGFFLGGFIGCYYAQYVFKNKIDNNYIAKPVENKLTSEIVDIDGGGVICELSCTPRLSYGYSDVPYISYGYSHLNLKTYKDPEHSTFSIPLVGMPCESSAAEFMSNSIMETIKSNEFGFEGMDGNFPDVLHSLIREFGTSNHKSKYVST